MSIEIRATTDADDEKWDDFVLNHKNGNIYHHSAWRQVLQRTFGYKPLYLALANDSSKEFDGIFPVMYIESPLTGKRLISLPFSSFCSLLVDNDRIDDLIKFSMAQHPAQFLALKLCDNAEKLPETLRKDCSFVTHFIDLTVGETALLSSFHATSVRQRINRAGRDQKLSVRFAQGEDDLKRFFRLHTRVRRKHGLPPHPYQFFANMWRIMAPKNMLSVPFIECEGKMVCAAIVLKYKDTVSYEYSAADEDYLHLSTNQLLAWEVMKSACSEGVGVFDFGRSALENESLIEYKDHWGGRKCFLNYYYYPEVDRLGEEGSLGRRILTSVNRLLPSALLQLEGKYLYRHLG